MTTVIVNRKTLARVLNVSVRTLANLEANGVITPVERGAPGRSATFDLTVAVPAYIEYAAPTGRSEAKARKDLADAKMAELRLSREHGKLIEFDRVMRESSMFDRAIVAKLRAIPHRAVNTGILDRQSAVQLDGLIREIRQELYELRTVAMMERIIDEDTATEEDFA